MHHTNRWHRLLEALLRHLLANGSAADVSVVVLSRNPVPFLAAYPHSVINPQITFLKGDIQQRDTLPGYNFTHVLHAATDSTFGPRLTPLQRYDQIVDGTRNILDLALSTGARRFRSQVQEVSMASR